MRRLRMGLIGGAAGSFIGPVHAMAARLDGQIDIVAGTFSSDAERSRAAAPGYGVDPARAYGDYRRMLASERDQLDFVTIATPNHLHLPIALAALEAGIPVMSEKPATATLAEARILADAVQAAALPYGLTFTYTGYPLVREARRLCAEGRLGRIRKVVVEYSQGWLSQPIEREGQKQAAWRADPAQAGIGGCIGDIGVHAFNLAEFVTGLQVERLCADLNAVAPGRALDDDCNVLLRYAGGVPGVLVSSQIAAGDRNGLRLRVYGEDGGLNWRQEQPDRLTLNWGDGRSETIHGGADVLGQDARAASRLPTGHPEGFLEALANLYRDFAAAVRGDAGRSVLVPGIHAGLRSMAFVERAVAASRDGAGWVPLTL